MTEQYALLQTLTQKEDTFLTGEQSNPTGKSGPVLCTSLERVGKDVGASSGEM